MLEAAIWRQERRVALYHFDPEWQKKSRRVYHGICDGAWKCAAYREFRESKRLLEVGPWPASADEDEQELSTFLLDAFRKVFRKVREVAPDAEHTALTYSGHGARADGSLFQGAIAKHDTATLMQEITGITPGVNLEGGNATTWNGRAPFSFLNFGGNCAEGRWNMVASLYPYAEYILASDLDVGGVEFKRKEMTTKLANMVKDLKSLEVLRREAETEPPLRELLDKVVDARTQLWDKAWKKPIQRQDLEQAIAIYEPSGFEPFRAALREAYLALPDATARLRFEEHVEEHWCDVLDAVRFFEPGSNSTTAMLSTRTKTQRRLRSHGATAAPSLEEKFMALRVKYASTREMIHWDKHANGLGFNFLGAADPPCDLVTPLGNDAPEPKDGWHQDRLQRAREKFMR